MEINWIAVAILAFIAFLAYQYGKPKPAPPVLLQALDGTPNPYPDSGLLRLDKAPPVIGKGLLVGLEKGGEVRAHLQYIDEGQRQISSYYGQCLSAFQAARAHVVEQRRHLRVTAEEVKRRTEGASTLLAGRKAIQTPIAIALPAMPKYQTQADYDKRFQAIANGAALGFGRLIQSNADIRAKAVAAVGVAAFSIVTFQKSVRQMAEADGQLRRYRSDIAQHLDIFRRSYPELVARSRDIFALEMDIRECLDGTTAETWQRYSDGACLAQERELADRLLTHAMNANIYMAVAD